jgi:hypothetical protein
MKTCSTCKEIKPVLEFYKDKSQASGIKSECKICSLNRNKEWRLANPEKETSRCRKWKKANKNKVAGYNKKYTQANKDKKAVYYKEYAKTNRAKRNALGAKRHAKKLKAAPKWLTMEQLAEIEELYKLAKQLEKETGIKHHVDHIIPLQGQTVSGLHVPNNLRVVSAIENLIKGNRHG